MNSPSPHRDHDQLVTHFHQLKMPAADGKNYLTDVATAIRQAEGMAPGDYARQKA